MENSMKEQAIEYGHSTPEMAANFALAAKAKRLCINHLSPRYRPISSIKSSGINFFEALLSYVTLNYHTESTNSCLQNSNF
jgi:ribonuclease Z